MMRKPRQILAFLEAKSYTSISEKLTVGGPLTRKEQGSISPGTALPANLEPGYVCCVCSSPQRLFQNPTLQFTASLQAQPCSVDCLMKTDFQIEGLLCYRIHQSCSGLRLPCLISSANLQLEFVEQ
ncbi:Eukaryotic Translation Initiation Factor 2 Subunit 2 [Manis pentadactyla]|nr:Eukaryotic Translation Initiation Factor 2 Subunit 2 [Manis pentadactyla]